MSAVSHVMINHEICYFFSMTMQLRADTNIFHWANKHSQMQPVVGSHTAAILKRINVLENLEMSVINKKYPN